MSQRNIADRVGIVLVHGIGEQHRFEHLDEVVKNIALTLQDDSNVDSIQVSVNTSGDTAYQVLQQTWRSEGTATAVIEVKSKSGKLTYLEFREVWWSDLDETTSLKTFLDFWYWGLSLWSKSAYDDSNIGTASKDMRLPGRSLGNGQDGLLPDRDKNLQPLHSLYLFLVSVVIFLLLPLLWVLGRLLRSILGFDIRPDILVEYLGDIKLYQQDKRIGKKLLVDIEGNPPRVAIRRRVVSAFVETALEEYDRWYVLSHSLGTILAFNGLMETEKSLPNYLEQSLWKRWCNKRPNHCKFKNQDENEQLTEEDSEKMMPKRPSWLELDDIIDRRELFSKLKGFMTYGSPLSKFAVLWPSIVPLNKDESVFRDDFEWINVFDPTDPVSDFTRFFDSKGGETGKRNLTPREVPYKADKVHLLSHGEYLTFNSKRSKFGNPLVRQVSRWLISGNQFTDPLQEDGDELANNRRKFHGYRLGWPEPKIRGKDSKIVSFYFGIGICIWFLLGIVISFVLSWIFPWFIDQISNFLIKLNLVFDLSQVKQWLSNPLFFIGTTFVVVLVVGCIASFFKENKSFQ
jgi:hypothetical protein